MRIYALVRATEEKDVSKYAKEAVRGERFELGENPSRFPGVPKDERIAHHLS